jgi:hypothetical protein
VEEERDVLLAGVEELPLQALLHLRQRLLFVHPRRGRGRPVGRAHTAASSPSPAPDAAGRCRFLFVLSLRVLGLFFAGAAYT